MKSLINNTVLAIMIATTIISCSKENVMQETQTPNETFKSSYGINFSKSDTPYVSGIKLDTPYVVGNLHKGADTPYLGYKLVDTPYINTGSHRNMDTPYVVTKALDTPYLRR
jgi:hypothetical protein